KKRRLRRLLEVTRLRTRNLFSRRRLPLGPILDPVALALPALQQALGDESAVVRLQAVSALGQIGPAASVVAPRLIALLQDADETVRCQAAEALGLIHAPEKTEHESPDADATPRPRLGPLAKVAALVELLRDASVPVK